MANMNLKDALNKALRTTKQYIDKAIEENGFSGDYNDLENRPCYEDITIETGTIIFDGTIKDTDEVIDLGYGTYAVKVLNAPIQKEGLIGRTATLQRIEEGELTVTISDSYIMNGSVIGIPNTSILFEGCAIIVYKDNLNFNGVILNKGTYFLTSETEPSTYISYLEYEAEISDLKQLDEKFIPDTIARVENLPYCDTRTTEPAIITYDGDYPSKQIVVLYEGEWQIECFVRIHDSLSFAEESDIVAITIGGSPYMSGRVDTLETRKLNEKVTVIKDMYESGPYLLNVKSDTVLNTSEIGIPTNVGEVSLSEGLWAYHMAAKQDVEPSSLEEDNGVNAKGLANYYVREVEYNKTVKGSAKRVDGRDYLTTKKYVDNVIIKDYNGLENRPCYDSYATVEYIYDGNFVGKPTALYDRLVKVSDDVVTYEEFKNATFTFNYYYKTVTYNMSSMEEGLDYYLSDDGLSLCGEYIYIAYEDNATCEGVTFPQKGIYFYDSEAMVDSSSNVNAKVITVGYVCSLSISRKEFKQLDEKFIPDTITTKYLDYQVENIAINKLHHKNIKVDECTRIYEWDRESGKNSSDLILEVLQPSTNYDYHDLFLKSDTFISTIVKPAAYYKDRENYYAIVLNDSVFALHRLYDHDYYGINCLKNREGGTVAIKNSEDDTIVYSYCSYPYSPTDPIDTGYQCFSYDTYDPDNNTLHVNAACKKGSQINNVKIYKIEAFKMINTSFDYTKDTMNFIKNEYGSEYELKFSMVAKVDDRDQNNYDYNGKSYGALIYFHTNTSCIVDWGDGTIEKFANIKRIDHPYKTGYYHVNIYSKNYLPIYWIDSFYDIQINLIDISEHTSIARLFYSYVSTGSDNRTTLNCEIDFSKAQNCEDAFTNITNLNPNVFANATNINNLNNAFCGNSWITEIPSTLNTSKVTDFYCAFQAMQGITHIPTLNLSSASRFDAVFFDSTRIKTMDELDFGQGTFTEVDNCFAACHSLTEAKLKNTGRITCFTECFLDCISLEKVSELDISSIDMIEEEKWFGEGLTVNGLNSIFHNCHKLKDVKLVGEATADKINAFINELPTNPVEGITRTLDISACTNKNGVTATADTWTIVK